MSSWEKWVFPQEVNAFPSPSFFSFALLVYVVSSIPPPQTPWLFSFFLFGFSLQVLVGIRLNNAAYTNQCCSLTRSCEVLWRKMSDDTTRPRTDATALIFLFHVFNITPWWWLFDYSQLLKVRPQRLNLHWVFRQEVIHRCPHWDFSFLRSLPHVKFCWCVVFRQLWPLSTHSREFVI